MERVILFVQNPDALPEIQYKKNNIDIKYGLSGKTELKHGSVFRQWVATVRDPQRRMHNLSQYLHTQSRAFAGLATRVDPFSDLPPLRQFAKDYATFLSRMCQTRGCLPTLLRTVELTEREGCFATFLLDQFFSDDPNASTLPACRAVFTESLAY